MNSRDFGCESRAKVMNNNEFETGPWLTSLAHSLIIINPLAQRVSSSWLGPKTEIEMEKVNSEIPISNYFCYRNVVRKMLVRLPRWKRGSVTKPPSYNLNVKDMLLIGQSRIKISSKT